MSEVRDRLLWAAAQTLRPIVRRLLALGVPFGELELRLRELFVDVAEKDLAAPRRRQTDSRISLVTGINRKEVKRIRSQAGREQAPRLFTMNHATSLIGRWTSERRYTDERGRPRPLPYRAARGASFTSLARSVTGDLAPGVLLDELARSGAVEVRGDGLVVLRSDAYVPKLDEAEKLQILGEDPPELVETILRNVFRESDDVLLQRKVYYDNLGAESATRVRIHMRREGERFLRRVNRLLSRYDRDRNPSAPGGRKHYAAIGVYFFDATEPDGAAPEEGSSKSGPADHEKV